MRPVLIKPECLIARRALLFYLPTKRKTAVLNSRPMVLRNIASLKQRLKPPVLNKQAESEMNDEFKSLQNIVKLACAKEWSQQTAKVIWDIPVRCKNRVCEKGMDPGVPTIFTSGTITDACAPHDALSKMIVLNTKSGSYPKLLINW